MKDDSLLDDREINTAASQPVSVAPTGFLVWWHVPTRCARRSVVRAFQAAGMPLTGLKRPASYVALRRACEQVEGRLRRKAKEGPGEERLLLRPIHARGKATHYALTRETVSEDGEISTVLVSELQAAGDDPAIATEDHPVADEVLEIHEREREVIAGRTVSAALLDLPEVARGAASMEARGLYWFPWRGATNKNPALVKLRAVLGAIEGTSLHVVTTYDDRRTRRSITPAAEATLSRDLDVLRRRVEGWTGWQKKRLERAQNQILRPLRMKIDHWEARLEVNLKPFKKRADEIAVLIEDKLKHPGERRIKRPRLDEEEPHIEDALGLNLKQRKTLLLARQGIHEAIGRENPYLRNVVDVALASVAHHCGVAAANGLIDEFDLTAKCGVRPLEEKP